MNTDILFFLLGYPLSIFANLSTDFLKAKIKTCDVQPLKKLFISAFFTSLKHNKDKVDNVGRKAIQEIENIISDDKEKLFLIIQNCLGFDNFKIFEMRGEEFKNLLVHEIIKEFNLNQVNLAKAVIIDCLNQYEIAFFSELTEKEGIHFIINNLKKLNSDVAKQDDIEKLREFIVNSFSMPRTKNNTFTEEFREFLDEELSNPSSKFFANSIVYYMSTLKKKVEQLTADQYQVIHYLRHQNRVIISGCAGSGKTLLVAEKAIRLDQAGIKTLILCHNPLLADYITNLVNNPSIHVSDFTKFVNSLINKQIDENGSWNVYIEPHKEDIELAFDKIDSMPPIFEAVIIDEGQDFRELWWLLIESIVEKSKNKILYIFFDDNQALLPFRSKFPIKDSPISMSKNCRNGGNIFEIVKKFHPNSPLISQFLSKDGIAKITIFDGDNLRSKMSEAVQDANKYTNIDEIIVLTNESSIENSPIKDIQFLKFQNLHWRNTIIDDLTLVRNRLLAKINRAKSRRNYLETTKFNDLLKMENIEEYLKVPLLSYDISPTNEDVEAVYKYARKLSPYFEGEINRCDFFQDFYGRLCLIEIKGSFRLSEVEVKNSFVNATIKSKLHFYSNQDWAISLPKAKDLTKIVPYYLHSPSDQNTIPLYTVDLFKGLEADAIILFINTINNNLETEMYVGSSRAIGYLNIVINKAVLAKMNKLKDKSFLR